MLGLPTVLALVTVGLHLLLGASTLIELGGLSALDLIVIALVIVEELWCGYEL